MEARAQGLSRGVVAQRVILSRPSAPMEHIHPASVSSFDVGLLRETALNQVLELITIPRGDEQPIQVPNDILIVDAHAKAAIADDRCARPHAAIACLTGDLEEAPT
jgi:hypothetical protein